MVGHAKREKVAVLFVGNPATSPWRLAADDLVPRRWSLHACDDGVSASPWRRLR